jgi:signal transduction histidine kinase
VIGFARLLQRNRRGTFSPQDLTFLQRIGANGVHLLSLINDVLDLAKIEAGHVALERAPIDALALVRTTIGELDGQAKMKGVLLITELPDPLEPLLGDHSKLKQVLINLVGNALKFTARGHVTVRVVADPTGRRPLAIEVQDTGIGIPNDRLEVVFDAFEQAESSTSRRYGGTGLGLSISRELCEKMGYGLCVTSVPGEGSTFAIRFPQPDECAA